MRRNSSTRTLTRPRTQSKPPHRPRGQSRKRGPGFVSTARRKFAELPSAARLPVSIMGIVLVIFLAIGMVGGAGYGIYRTFTAERMNPVAYQDSLISVANSDLPAPPFIGWDQTTVEEPPVPLQPNEELVNVNNQECAPGAERHRELNWLIMANANRWSGTELFNSAYNSHIRIDASNSSVASNGLDYGIVDRWIADCGFVSFDHGESTVRITYRPLDVDMSVWDFTDGRAWIQTVATTTPTGFEGSSSTITTLGHAPGVTLQTALTFRGRADDNAIRTMDLLWSAQATKAKITGESSNRPTGDADGG